MLRASVILKNTRLDKGYEIGEISKKLKVPAHHLTAIENEDVPSFPTEPYCSLIVREYAQCLGLNGTDVLSLFRRDFAQKIKPKNSQKSFISLTPQFTFSVGIIILVVGFSLYLISEYFKFNLPPHLKVNWPQNLSVNTTAVEITGLTDPESTVRINQDLVIVDPTGFFQKKVSISTSSSTIFVESSSTNGKTSKDSRVLNFN